MKNSKSKSIPYKKRSNSRQGYVPINSPLEGEEKGFYARTMAKFRRVPFPSIIFKFPKIIPWAYNRRHPYILSSEICAPCPAHQIFAFSSEFHYYQKIQRNYFFDIKSLAIKPLDLSNAQTPAFMLPQGCRPSKPWPVNRAQQPES